MAIDAGTTDIKALRVGSTVISRAFLGNQKIYDQLDYPTLDLNFALTKTLDPRITFTRASSGTFFDSNGAIQTAPVNTPRFDHDPLTGESLGLLIEEQRTNSIRNNTMVGAVAGTPGTLPTNWSVAFAGGLTTNVIGTGTSNGVSYVDLQITGTSSANLYTLVFDSTTQIAASVGQNWAWSSWIAFVGGSLSNITTVTADFRESNSGGTQLAAGGVALSTLTSSLVRQSATRTLSQATTAFIQPRLRLTITNGAAIDITLRIGLPQLEQGAFATSVIPTTTAAATRSADVASITGSNFSSWYNQTEGTVFTNCSINYTVPGSLFPLVSSLNDGTSNNRIENGFLTASLAGYEISASGSAQVGMYPNASSALTRRLATTYQLNNFAASVNGGSVSTDTSGIVPTVNQLRIGDRVTGGTQALNGPSAASLISTDD